MNHTGMNSATDRPSQQRDPNDPWFQAYEVGIIHFTIPFTSLLILVEFP